MPEEESARWCCPNRDCNWFMVAKKTKPAAAAPKCVCGHTMRMVEMLPALSYLDFLHGDVPVMKKAGADEE